MSGLGIAAAGRSMAMQQQNGVVLRACGCPPSSVLKGSVVAAKGSAAAATYPGVSFEARGGPSSSSFECAVQCEVTGVGSACPALESVSGSAARSQRGNANLRGAHRHRPRPSTLVRRRCSSYFDGDFEEDRGSVAPAARSTRNLLAEVGFDDLSFFERLALVWSIFFHSSPRRKSSSSSNAEIAKQRLKMILVSDRCSVNDEAKKKIVNNIVGSLADFVEIEAEDRVELSISSDPSVGTVYSVTVPVRRVKPEYQTYSRGLQNADALDEDFAEEFRTVDIKIEYPENVWSINPQN